jgi:hypothetical protein
MKWLDLDLQKISGLLPVSPLSLITSLMCNLPKDISVIHTVNTANRQELLA